MSYQYFFSSPDKDFKPTGSRDPLGLQVIWQEAGSAVIPFLSTVSSNIQDFKIMCLGNAYFGEDLDRSTFIRFEQLCAYTRYYFGYKRFNGIEKVVQRFNTSPTYPIIISANKANTLLTSQITYGIWGKYNRPYNSMQLKPKYQLPKLSAKESYILDLCKKEQFELTEKMIQSCKFIHLTADDKDFFTNNLLRLDAIGESRAACNRQNELYLIFKDNTDVVEEVDFFKKINMIQEKSSEDLKNALENIIQTERVIAPLNRIFKHIQTRKVWTKEQLDEKLINYVDKLKAVDYTFQNNNTKRLQEILNTKDTWKIIEGLVEVNKVVTQNRKKTPWISREKQDFILNEKNGAVQIDYWEGRPENEFYYFLNTYTELYKEIKK